MKITRPILFRPHHFLCTVGFQGMGYSPSFIHNYTHIKDQITSDPETLIEVRSQTDAICGPCPHNTGSGHCQKEAHIQSLDAKHKAILYLQEREIVSWKEGLSRIKTHMTLESFHNACSTCEWKTLGVCERALKNLLENDTLF